MALVPKQDTPFSPVDVRLLGAAATMLRADGGLHLVREPAVASGVRGDKCLCHGVRLPAREPAGTIKNKHCSGVRDPLATLSRGSQSKVWLHQEWLSVI